MPFFGARHGFPATPQCDCASEPCAHDVATFTRACKLINPDAPVPPLASLPRLASSGSDACRVALGRRIAAALDESACVERWTRRLRSGALEMHNELQFLVELLALPLPDDGGLSPLLAKRALVEALDDLGVRSVGSDNEARQLPGNAG